MVEKEADDPAALESKPLEQIHLGAFATPDGIDRRDFNLRIAAALFGGASAIFSGSNLAMNVVNYKATEDRDQREARERADAAAFEKQKNGIEQRSIIQSLLFGEEQATQYYIPGTDNPYSEIKGITPHVGYALRSIVKKLGFTEETVQCVERPQTPRIDGSVILLGGPVPNVFSRQIMGIGRGSPIFSRARGENVELPIHFRNILTSVPIVGKRPRYDLIVQGRSLENVDRPTSDYLVLTSIPNIFSNKYGIFNHRILIASGLHGGGMRAMHLLLDQQPDVLNEIIKESQEHHKCEHGWQALIRVDNVDLTNGMSGTLREKKVFPIPLNFGQARRVFEKKNFWIDPNDDLLRA